MTRAWLFVAIIVLAWVAWDTGSDPMRLVRGLPWIGDFLRRMMPPDLSVLPAALSGAQVALVAGLIVGALWMLRLPPAATAASVCVAVWLYALPPAAAAAWVVLRAFGSIILVPMAEELAFRGYLHRALIARRVETVAQGQFTWLAFTVSTVLFGLIHQRWLAAMLAGAAYAILMYRTGRLADPIAAHMASNAAIVFWAVAAGQWSLL